MKKVNVQPLQSKSPKGAEFLNAICSNLSFAGKEAKKILIASWDESDGKTFMAQNIAGNMAVRGKRVVTVSANLRREENNGGKKQGLLQFLSGQCALKDILYPTGDENAFMVPAGGKTEMAVSYLERVEFPGLLDALAEQFDLVLVDTPALGKAIDAAEIAKYCDGAVLVAKYNSTTGANMKKIKKQLNRAGCPILGCVINQVAATGFESKRMLNSIGL